MDLGEWSSMVRPAGRGGLDGSGLDADAPLVPKSCTGGRRRANDADLLADLGVGRSVKSARAMGGTCLWFQGQGT